MHKYEYALLREMLKRYEMHIIIDFKPVSEFHSHLLQCQNDDCHPSRIKLTQDSRNVLISKKKNYFLQPEGNCACLSGIELKAFNLSHDIELHDRE